MKRRIAAAALIGTASGLFCCFLLTRLHQQAGDFHWALHLAHRLVEQQNPYDTPLEQYPLPAAFPALPFLHVREEIAGGMFFGISSALLVLGLTREGFGRLRVLLAFPFWAGLLAAQWMAVITASAFFPLLLPFTMMKPQVGLPVFLTRLSRRGLVACIFIAGLSLAIYPRWPLLWLGQIHYYDFFIPILVFPGPFLLMALLRYRERDAWLLLLAALMPQRWFFDSFTLWLIPKSKRQMLFTAVVSWGAGIWRWYHQPATFTDVGRLAVIFIYLPMLAVVLFRDPASLADQP